MVLAGSLSNVLKKVLDCGTSAEPSRYLYSSLTMHMVLGGISANPVEKSFGLWHFCRAIKTLVQYLYYAQMARLSVGVYLIYPDDLGFWALLLLKKSFLPLN